MGHFRFQKRIGGKFFRINLSKTGISTTSGAPRAHLNIPLISSRKRRSMITLGMPGTGLSYRQPLGGSRRRQRQQAPGQEFEASNLVVIGFVIMVVLWFFFGH